MLHMQLHEALHGCYMMFTFDLHDMLVLHPIVHIQLHQILYDII